MHIRHPEISKDFVNGWDLPSAHSQKKSLPQWQLSPHQTPPPILKKKKKNRFQFYASYFSVLLLKSEESFLTIESLFWRFRQNKEIPPPNMLTTFVGHIFRSDNFFLCDLLCRPFKKKLFFSKLCEKKKSTGGKNLLFLKPSSKNELRRAANSV